MKIRNIMFTLAIIAIAAFSFIKANGSEKLSDVALANIEALADNEGSDNWYCVGEFFTCLLDEQGRIYGEKHYIK